MYGYYPSIPGYSTYNNVSNNKNEVTIKIIMKKIDKMCNLLYHKKTTESRILLNLLTLWQSRWNQASVSLNKVSCSWAEPGFATLISHFIELLTNEQPLNTDNWPLESVTSLISLFEAFFHLLLEGTQWTKLQFRHLQL